MKNFARLAINGLIVLSSLLCLNCMYEEEEDYQLSNKKGKGDNGNKVSLYSFSELASDKFLCESLSNEADKARALRGACSSDGKRFIACEESGAMLIKKTGECVSPQVCVDVPTAALTVSDLSAKIAELSSDDFSDTTAICVNSQVNDDLDARKKELDKSTVTPISDESSTQPEAQEQSDTCTLTLNKPSPEHVSINTPVEVAADSIKFTWTKNCSKQIAGYRFEIFKDSRMILKGVQFPTDSSQWITLKEGVNIGDVITWKVQACEKAYCEKGIASASADFRWVIEAPKPNTDFINISSNQSSASATMKWSAVAGQSKVQAYQLAIVAWDYRATDSIAPTVKPDNKNIFVNISNLPTSTTSYTWNPPKTTSGVSYVWKIRSCLNANCSCKNPSACTAYEFSHWAPNQRININ